MTRDEEARTAPGRLAPWRERLHEIIFEADTPAGKAFDVALLLAIVLSVIAVMLESVADVRARYRPQLLAAEWTITCLFTVEYVLRLACVRKPWRYALSFFGVVDLLAVLPAYLGLLVPGAHSLSVVRSLRLLRAFRVFKLAHLVSEATVLRRAVWASRAKIAVFLATVLVAVVIMGSAMHLIEGEEAGFTSIPQGMYWSIVTMTTVGYGDIAPETPLGKTLAALMMILGYSLLIVPTGILSAELARPSGRGISTQACPSCSREGHDRDARHCKHCGASL